MDDATRETRKPGFVVLRQLDDDTWQMIGEVRDGPGSRPARHEHRPSPMPREVKP